MLDGASVRIVKINEETALDKLPARIYSVEFAQLLGYYLSIVKDQFEVPAKIYGRTNKRAEKILYSYQDRDAATGVLLTGDKGTGKSLLMSLIANKAITELNLPVILIKNPYIGSDFTNFVENIGECVLIFDEFGKMYSNSKHSEGPTQNDLLSLMDGVDKTKRLSIFTENSDWDISEFMLGRPGRAYYHIRHKKLDEASITGYCEDHNVSSEIVDEIVDLSRRSRLFSFDMLQSIVEEHIRFGEHVEDIVDDLNIDTRQETVAMMEVLEVFDLATNEKRVIHDTPFVTKPTSNSWDCEVKVKRNFTEAEIRHMEEEDEELEERYDEFYVRIKDLSYEKNGKSVYETDRYRVIAKDVPKVSTNYSLLV